MKRKIERKKKSEKLNKVVCATCKTSFNDPIYKGQAMHCASTVSDTEILGHYGSTVIDMELWKWVNRPKCVKNGNMCDKCIQGYIDAGNLSLIRDGIW